MTGSLENLIEKSTSLLEIFNKSWQTVDAKISLFKKNIDETLAEAEVSKKETLQEIDSAKQEAVATLQVSEETIRAMVRREIEISKLINEKG